MVLYEIARGLNEMGKQITSVAVYVRKSRPEETEETLNRQQNVLTELCKRNGWEYELFKEVGSSQDLEREGLQKMLEKVKLFLFDAVVIADLDRLSRNTVHFGLIKEVFVNSGCLAVTPSKIYDFSKNDDDFMSDIFSVMAKQEYQMIKKRLIRGMRESAKQGNWVGKKVPVGYQYNRETKRLEPSVDAPIIQRLFREYIEGFSTKELAFQFTRERVTTSTGLQWTSAGISRILDNVVYLGHSLYGKTKTVNGKRAIRTDESEQILVKYTHESIITQELWDEVQRVKKERNSKPVALKLGKHKFSGLIRCGLCGAIHSFQTSKYKRKRISSCQTRNYSESSDKYSMCPNKGANLVEFEELFHRYFSKYVEQLEQYVHLIKENGLEKASSGIETEIENKEKQVKKLQGDIKRVQQGFVMEIFTEEEAHRQIKEFREQIETLDEQIKQLKEQEESSELDRLELTLEKLKRFLTHGDQLPEREANQILTEFIDTIIYTKTETEIELEIVMK